MKRRWVALAGLTGLAAGSLGTLALQPDPVPPATTVAVDDVPLPGTDSGVLLVWTPGGLPAGLPDALGRLPVATAVTTVHGGTLDLVVSADADGIAVDRAPPGYFYPLDAVAVDPSTYVTFVPSRVHQALAVLGPGQALLGATSARLRRLGPGARLDLREGGSLTVAGVVPDEVVGGAEVVVPRTWPAAATLLPTPRYALIAHGAERNAVEAAVRAAVPAGTPVRVRGPGETPFLREGDAVLPQALIKERFGEFAVRRAGGTAIEQDPAWVTQHIVAATVPLLGTVRCHRAIVPALTGAMRELERRELGFLVDQQSFGGCWVAGLVPASNSVSRHSWGAAFDINVRKNPTGVTSTQDRRLMDVLARWGFTSGAIWLVPDAAYFEYVQPPQVARR